MLCHLRNILGMFIVNGAFMNEELCNSSLFTNSADTVDWKIYQSPELILWYCDKFNWYARKNLWSRIYKLSDFMWKF